MRTRPKYQVFISSTYGDLREEREAVTWVVLSARHIPSGMENFTATDDRGWQTIKSAIDRSDYYILIVAGKYGSVDVDGKSWTEKEYDYAVSRGIPVLAFVRVPSAITADKTESNSALRKKLEKFRQALKSKHLCQEWSTKEDLVNKVSSSLLNHITDDEDSGRTRPGWYRGDEIPSLDTIDEFARLSSENARLKDELEKVKVLAETGPRLRLADRLENPLPARIVERRILKTSYPVRDTSIRFSKDNLQEEDLAVNIISLLDLAVHNHSTSMVESVIVDLTLYPISGFRCGRWDGRDLSNKNGKLTNYTVRDIYQHEFPEFIELIEPNRIRIRTRFPQISAGGTEYLHNLAILGATEENRSFFNLEYKIVGSIGLPAKGLIEHEILFEGKSTFDQDELKNEKQILNRQRNITILTDMFL